MKFVQFGREVMPRLKTQRTEKAVIVDIKDDVFVIIMKQDKTREIVRVKDLVLTDRVYTEEELADNKNEFYQRAAIQTPSSDFDRHVESMRSRIAADLLKEKGL